MSARRLTRAVAGWALLLALGGTDSLHAQQTRIPATVEYIAGADIYLGAGTDQGVAASDTLVVFAASDGDPIGRFVVVSATATRAVVSFLGTPFPVTRGATLYLANVSTAVPTAPATRAVPTPGGPGGRGAFRPSVHGRLAFQTDAFETTTLWQSNQLESFKRRFATPSVALRAVVADLPGGLSLATNLRGVYRYSDPDLIDPAALLHVYEASVSKTFSGAVPFTIQAGRFNNRYVNFSGFWDGLLLRLGGRGLGVGVAAGYEPQRGDAGVSTDLPKGTAFVTYDAGRGPVRYATSVSMSQVRPRNGLLDHTFGTWSQYVRVGRIRFGNDLQVDRNPETSRWVLSRLNANASVPLAPGLEVHGRVSMYQPYQIWLTSNLMPFRRDQASVGLFTFGRAGSAGADFTISRLDGGSNSYAYSAAFSLLRTPIFGLDWSGSGSYWMQGDYTTLFAAAGLARSFGRSLARATYQLYRSDQVSLTSVSHSVDAGLSFPIAGTLSATIQGRIQRGANLRTTGLFVGFWTSF